jgi:predicted nucleotidyltransferase
MKRNELIEKLLSLKPALEAEGVEHIALFGSRARGDHTADSDIDLLVEVEANARFSLLDLIGVEHLISDTTGLRANATMRRSLDSRFREAIKNDVVSVF